MSDRELLELAASSMGSDLKTMNQESRSMSIEWNPLKDNGDAFRLQCGLSMRVYVYRLNGDDYTVAAADQLTQRGAHVKESHNTHGVEAATRRAIVRAAAAMGEQL